jgi:glucose-1-phosphate thymidylyltransferase
MAGMGTRMRPHTLTIPKPLITLAGKTIVERLIEGLHGICKKPINEIAFVIGDLGEMSEELLKNIAKKVGAETKIYHQNQALGTAHAVWCAEESLDGEIIIAFADTLFFADFNLSSETDSTIWVQKVENPEAYGVVLTDENNKIVKFIEKPKEKISDLAIVGIYYFKNGKKLREELNYLIENDIKKNGEYQLTTVLENMKNKGYIFDTANINEWLDCGNKNLTIQTHQRILSKISETNTTSNSAHIENSSIIQPCFIDSDVKIFNSVIGPYVSVHKNSTIRNSVIENSIIQSGVEINNANIFNSMIGNNAKISVKKTELSVGDYNQIEI